MHGRLEHKLASSFTLNSLSNSWIRVSFDSTATQKLVPAITRCVQRESFMHKACAAHTDAVTLLLLQHHLSENLFWNILFQNGRPSHRNSSISLRTHPCLSVQVLSNRIRSGEVQHEPRRCCDEFSFRSMPNDKRLTTPEVYAPYIICFTCLRTRLRSSSLMHLMFSRSSLAARTVVTIVVPERRTLSICEREECTCGE